MPSSASDHDPVASDETEERSWLNALLYVGIASAILGALCLVPAWIVGTVSAITGAAAPTGITERWMFSGAGESAPWFLGFIGAAILGLDIAASDSTDPRRRQRLAAIALFSGAAVIVVAVVVIMQSRTTNLVMLVVTTVVAVLVATEVFAHSRRPAGFVRRAERASEWRGIARAVVPDRAAPQENVFSAVLRIIVAAAITAAVASIVFLAAVLLDGAYAAVALALTVAAASALLGASAGSGVVGFALALPGWLRTGLIANGFISLVGLFSVLWNAAHESPPLIAIGIAWAASVGFVSVAISAIPAARMPGVRAYVLLGAAIGPAVARVARGVAARAESSGRRGAGPVDDRTGDEVVTDEEIEAARRLFGMGAGPVDDDPSWTP